MGNRLLQISCEIFKLCWRLDVPFVWENPLCSFQWWHPLAKEIASLEGVSDLCLHQCAYGARWYKPTRLRVFGLRDTRDLERKCKRRVVEGKWLCQHSGLPHIVLQGRDSQGVCWTARAAAYPCELCERLASCFCDTAFANEFAKALAGVASLGARRNRSQCLRTAAKGGG